MTPRFLVHSREKGSNGRALVFSVCFASIYVDFQNEILKLVRSKRFFFTSFVDIKSETMRRSESRKSFREFRRVQILFFLFLCFKIAKLSCRRFVEITFFQSETAV